MSPKRIIDGFVINGYYWMTGRFNLRRTGKVMKVQGVGKENPQRIDGVVLDTKTGDLTVSAGPPGDTDFIASNRHVFASELSDELTPGELTHLKTEVISRINKFFESDG